MSAGDMTQAAERVREIMDELQGVHIADAHGPNHSVIQFWQIGPCVVVVQVHAEGGFQYYLPGKVMKLTGIAADIRRYLDEWNES